MTRLMQTVSTLTFAAALAAAPVVASAQDAAQSDAEQAADVVPEKAGEATDDTAQAIDNAVEDAAQAADEAADDAAQAADEAADDAAEATEEAAEPMAEPMVEPMDDQAEGLEAEAPETGAMVAADDTTNAEVEAPVEEVVGTIVMQDENSILGSDLMGARVHNSEGDTIGNINDLIISLDGTVEGVVIGVGGFLGIGEKRAAVELQQITVRTDEDGKPQLILDTTKEALKAAPNFVSVRDQQAEQETQQLQQDPATGVGGGMAPAEGGAAAPAN